MTERLGVLWLIKGFGPGGAERLLASFAKVADHGSFDYEAAYLLPWKDHLVPALEASGVMVHCLGAKGEWDFRWAWRLRRLLTQRSFDVVHVHSPYAAAVGRPVIRSLPRARRPEVVYTEHNTWTAYSRLTRVLNALTFALNSTIVAVSHDVRESIPNLWRSSVEVLQHGIDLEEASELRGRRGDLRLQLAVDPGRVLVGTIANFTRHKDYPTLLQAAAQVVSKESRVDFVAVGQGPLENEIMALHRQLGLGERFRLLGYREDAVAVMCACDLFVLTSAFEGLPVALMEALSLGLPVVATAVGGVREAIRDGVEGLLVPPRRPDLLAEAILDLARDSERRGQMASAAHDSSQKFDAKRAAHRMEQIYRSSVSAARDSAPHRGPCDR